MWFLIPTTRHESNHNGSEEAISIKIHVLNKASVAKHCSGIRPYFVKQLEIDFFYLIVDSRILQCCFSLQPYWYLMHAYYIPPVHLDYYEPLKIFAWKSDLLIIVDIAWKASKYVVISGLYFSVFGLNMKNLLNLHIESECRKIWTRNNYLFGHFSCSVKGWNVLIANCNQIATPYHIY